VSINPADWKIANVFPANVMALGLDGAGVIEKVGEEVKELKVGDRVCWFAPKCGSYVEHYVTSAHHVAHIPDELSFADAAALPVASMTAYIVLHNRLRFQHGQSLFITAGSSAVGGAAIQLAHQHGLKVITTAGTKNLEAVKKLGASHVIDYTKSKDIPAEVKEHNGGEGCDIAIDCVGTETANMCLSAIHEHGGELATIAGAPNKAISGFGTTQSVHIASLGYVFATEKQHKQQLEFFEHLHHIAKLTAHHKFNARVAITLKSLDEVPKGIATVKEGHVAGKMVALVDADQGVVKPYVPAEHKKPHDDKAKDDKPKADKK